MKKKLITVFLLVTILLEGFLFALAAEEEPSPAGETASTEEYLKAPDETPAEQEPVVAVSGESARKEKPGIAVLDFKALGVSGSEAAFMSDFLRSDLVSSKAFRVIDRASMERILAEQGFQQTGCTTRECAVQMGKLLNAKNMVSGNFGKLAGLFQITINVVNVESGEIIYTDSVSCQNSGDLQSKTGELAFRLVKEIGLPPEETVEKEITPEPEKEKPVEETAESVRKRFGIPVGLPEEEFEPPVKMERLRRAPLFAKEAQEVKGVAPYYSFQFSEGLAIPSISTDSVSGEWFFASNLVNDIGLIIKPSERQTLLVFYELKYSGPGIERQEGRVFAERTMDHIIFGQYRFDITDMMRVKFVGNYMSEFQRKGTNEEWTTGKYNFERIGGDLRFELDDIFNGYSGSFGVQLNYLNFPNYADLLKELQIGEVAETIGGMQNQTTCAGVVSFTGKNLKISWKTELQAFENQCVMESNGLYGVLKQADTNSSLKIAARIGKRLSVSPVFIAKWKNSNQNYLHFKYFGDIPDFKRNYYDYSQASISAAHRWRVFRKLEIFFVPRLDIRNYSSRQPRDINNDFKDGAFQNNTTVILSGGFTRYMSEVSSYSIYYTYVQQASNMEFEKYQPYNYSGQYVGIRFNFTF